MSLSKSLKDRMKIKDTELDAIKSIHRNMMDKKKKEHNKTFKDYYDRVIDEISPTGGKTSFKK